MRFAVIVLVVLSFLPALAPVSAAPAEIADWSLGVRYSTSGHAVSMSISTVNPDGCSITIRASYIYQDSSGEFAFANIVRNIACVE